MHHLTEFFAIGTAGKRHIEHVGCRSLGPAVRIKRVLEHADHQYLARYSETVLGSIAVMHVEIDNRHPRKPVRLQGMGGGYRDVIEKAETHRIRPFGMMARRTHGTKGILHFTGHHQIDGHDSRTCRTQCGLPGVGIHRRIRIEVHDTLRGELRFRLLQMKAECTRSSCSKVASGAS